MGNLLGEEKFGVVNAELVKQAQKDREESMKHGDENAIKSLRSKTAIFNVIEKQYGSIEAFEEYVIKLIENGNVEIEKSGKRIFKSFLQFTYDDENGFLAEIVDYFWPLNFEGSFDKDSNKYILFNEPVGGVAACSLAKLGGFKATSHAEKVFSFYTIAWASIDSTFSKIHLCKDNQIQPE